VAIISVAGGVRDTLVRSDLASLDDIVPQSHGFTVVSTSVPNTWITIDHQVVEFVIMLINKCIMWCNQIVKALSFALYDLIDPKTSQATLPLPQRIKAFSKHLKRFFQASTSLIVFIVNFHNISL
jgi:glycosylphosphatidylinositol deacylase